MGVDQGRQHCKITEIESALRGGFILRDGDQKWIKGYWRMSLAVTTLTS